MKAGRVKGSPLPAERLVSAVKRWLTAHRFAGDAWADAAVVRLSNAYDVMRFLRVDPRLAKEPLADLADLVRCHGYRIEVPRSGGLVFRPGLCTAADLGIPF